MIFAKRFEHWRIVALVLFVIVSRGANGAELVVDDVMYQDPDCNVPKWRLTFSPQFKPLWLQALERPEAETRRMAADTLTIATGRGMKGLDDAAVKLRPLLKSERDPVVRRAIARAIVALQVRDAADDLAEAAANNDLLMAQIVEPALAEWNHPALRDTWLQRLEAPDVERGLLLLAIDCLGVTRESRAVKRLAVFVDDDLAPRELRLAAARALGKILEAGLTEPAEKLADRPLQPEFLGRLLAATLLLRHSDEASVQRLQRLANDQEPAVAVAALGRLQQIELQLALPFAPQAIVSADASLRHLGAKILIEQGNSAAIQKLGPLLNDRNPGVRRLVAGHMTAFAAQAELRLAVLEQAERMLATTEWRGVEQAALIVGSLDHKPAAPRLVELLAHERGESAIAAASALRKLRVAEALPGMLRHADSLYQQTTANKAPAHTGRQTRQLFQAFGEVRFLESEPLLRKFVPKSVSLDTEARAAACWALGYFHANQPDNDLVPLFVERLADVNSNPPEFPPVRQMVAVGLGRMRAESQLGELRRFKERDGAASAPGLACGWAIEQLTGEKMARIPFLEAGISGFFLEPIGP